MKTEREKGILSHDTSEMITKSILNNEKISDIQKIEILIDSDCCLLEDLFRGECGMEECDVEEYIKGKVIIVLDRLYHAKEILNKIEKN